MQKKNKLAILANDKLIHTQRFENSLFSIPPFYIDRRIRDTKINPFKCLKLSNKVSMNQSLSERTTANGKRNLTKRQISEDDILYLNSVYKSLWNKTNTQNFKNNLKKLLKSYYQIKERQKNELRQKAHKQRLEQVVRISKSIQELLRGNKKIYNQIKLQIHSFQSLKANQIKENADQQANLNEEDLSNIRFLQNFTSLFIDQNKQNYDFIEENVQNKMKKVESLIQSRQNHDRNETEENNQQLKKLFFNFIKRGQKQNIKSSQAGKIQSTIISQAQGKQVQIDKSNYLSNFHFLNDLNASESPSKFILANECDDSDQFSSALKQLLTEHNNQNQFSSLPSQVTPLRYKQIPSQNQLEIFKKDEQPYENKRNHNLSELLSKNLKSNTVLMESEEISKSGKIFQQKTKQLTKYKKNSKRKEDNKQFKKLEKKTYEYKNEKKEEIKKVKLINENRMKEKKQKNIKKNKIGLNYAKFIGKFLKLSQNEKIVTSSGRLQKFRKINLRQAFLKKDRHAYSVEQKQLKNCKEQIFIIKEEQNKKSDDGLVKKQSFSQSVDKKCRMTKYEQARLMYNMRNNKFRELSINFNSSPLNAIAENNCQRNKRPSFCNLLAPESQIRIKSKRGSFTRRKNDQKVEMEQLRIGSHSFIESKIHLSPLPSNKYLNLCSQTQLAKLTTSEEFDLQAVKSNITTYLRKVMTHNEKAIQLYNFLMYMQQSRKITLEQQQVNSSLDQFKIQKEQDEIKKIVSEIQPQIDDYQGCNNLYEYFNWNEKDILMTNRKFLDKLDARSIQLLYWNNQQKAKIEDLYQCSLKEIRNLPI